MSSNNAEAFREAQLEQAKAANAERSQSLLGFGLGALGVGVTVALARHPSLFTIIHGLTPAEERAADAQIGTIATVFSGSLSAFGFGSGFVSLNRASRHDGRAAAIEGALVALELTNHSMPEESYEQS